MHSDNGGTPWGLFGKDCCADAAQSFDLMRRRPAGFAVLTGEDAFFYGALTHGADGGVLASAHILHAKRVLIRYWHEAALIRRASVGADRARWKRKTQAEDC